MLSGKHWSDALSRIARKSGDARLSRDGTVKLKGKTVGVWWKEENDLYQFAKEPGGEPIVTTLFRHELMSAIAEHVDA